MRTYVTILYILTFFHYSLHSMNMEKICSIIITNDNHKITIPTCYLTEFKTISNVQELSTDNSISTPSLSFSDWKVLLPIIEIAYISKNIQNKTSLHFFFNEYEPLQNQDSLYSLLRTFDYLDHQVLYNLCCKKLSKQKEIKESLDIPLQTQNRIAHYLIKNTSLLDDIPLWISKKTALENNNTLHCKHSIWSSKYNHEGTLIAAGDSNGDVHLWNPKTKQETLLDVSRKPVSSVSFDRDNQLWVASQNGQITCWNLTDNSLTYIKHVHGKFPFSLCLHPQDNGIMAYDSNDHLITVFNKNNEQESYIIGHTDRIQALDIHPQGRHIISGGSDKQIRIADIETSRSIQKHTDSQSNGIYHINCISTNQFAVGTKKGHVSLIDIREKKFLYNMYGHTDIVWSCAHYKNNFLISSSCDSTVRIWDLRTLKTIKDFKVDTGNIHAIDISGDTLLTTSESGHLRLWNLKPFFGLLEETTKYFSNNLTLDQGTLIKKLYEAKKQNKKFIECKSTQENETLKQFSTYNQNLIKENLPSILLKKHTITITNNKNKKKIKTKK